MEFKNFSLDFLSDLPKEGRVYIYGAGKSGREIYSIIRKYRQDINIIGFIDTYRKSSRTMLFEEFRVKLPPCDLVIVSSNKYWREMEDSIRILGYKTIVPFKYRFNVTKDIKEKIIAVENMIIEGKETYGLVVDSVINRELDKVYNYHIEKKNTQNQYIDFVDFSSVFNVIEGGVYDGKISKKFLDLTMNKCIIHGFEIWGNKFLMDELKGNSGLRIYKKALWSSSNGTLFFPKDFTEFTPDGAFVVEEDDVDTYPNEENFKEVITVSIDDFIFEDLKGKAVDFIKLDVEGAEPEVLKGAEIAIRTFKPQMAIAVYHEFSHFYEIPLLVKEINPQYRLYFEHYGRGFSDSIMYFV